MKIFKIIALTLFAGYAAANPYQAPKLMTDFKHVELKEFTNLTLNIMPHVGTQLIFPFMLDDPLLTPQIKIDLTNKTGFTVPASERSNETILVNQNTITIVGNPTDNPQLGTLFVNIGGYNISIALRSVFSSSEISPSVIFDISENERNHLITHTVERYKKALKAEHDLAMARVDEQARNMALAFVGEVSLSYPRVKKFVSETKIQLDEGRMIFFADRMNQYDNFSVLAFEIDNPNNHDLRVDNIEFKGFEDKKDDIGKAIRGKFLCPEIIKRGVVAKCSFTTTSPLMQSANRLEISITTDIGTGIATW